MKHLFKYLLFLLVLFTTHTFSQTVINNNLVIGHVDSIYSKVLSEQRTIYISLPESATDPKYAKMTYPVLYIFDGDNHFSAVSSMLKQLALENGNVILPEMIVVGVNNTDRSRDFTPYKSSFWLYGTPSPLLNTGGGEKFVNFLQNELIPYINKTYPAAPYRTLIGHSLTGLGVSNILINHTDLFKSYIIIDPSMWYDNQHFLNNIKETLQQKNFNGTSLYLGIANSMPPNMDTTAIRRDTASATLHIRSILEFKDMLQAHPDNGLRFAYGYYNNDSHMSVPLITEYEGLRFIFNYYAFPNGYEDFFFNPKAQLDVGFLKTHFDIISKNMGYAVSPPEELIDNYADAMLDYGMPKKAFDLYKLALSDYPGSAKANEKMGDYYNSIDDKKKAIEYYRKAIKIFNDESIKVKIKNLEKTK